MKISLVHPFYKAFFSIFFLAGLLTIAGCIRKLIISPDLFGPCFGLFLGTLFIIGSYSGIHCQITEFAKYGVIIQKPMRLGYSSTIIPYRDVLSVTLDPYTQYGVEIKDTPRIALRTRDGYKYILRDPIYIRYQKKLCGSIIKELKLRSNIY